MERTNTGLRAGLADVALTRTPFDSTGISTRVLRFQLPEGTDPLWRAYWSGTAPGEPDR